MHEFLFSFSEIKEVRRKKERAKELEGIDTSNIVLSSRRRSTTSFVAPPKPKIPDESDSEDAEDTDDDDDDDEVEEEEDEGGDDDDDASQSEELNEGNSIHYHVPSEIWLFMSHCIYIWLHIWMWSRHYE